MSICELILQNTEQEFSTRVFEYQGMKSDDAYCVYLLKCILTQGGSLKLLVRFSTNPKETASSCKVVYDIGHLEQL